MKSETVAVLGASDNPERYAYKAIQLLRQHGHTVVPVNPTIGKIGDLDVLPSLRNVPHAETLTLYLGPARLLPLKDDIVALRPGRVIFNPGTESPEVQAALTAAGIPWLEACTLVLLNTGQF